MKKEEYNKKYTEFQKEVDKLKRKAEKLTEENDINQMVIVMTRLKNYKRLKAKKDNI